MLRRLALAASSLVLALAVAAAGAEAWVRWAGIESRAWPSIAFIGDPPRGLPGVDYLPRGFRLTDDGLRTPTGVCLRDPGPGVQTLLVLGDSTTVQSTDAEGRPVENLATWPQQLPGLLGAAWQVCTLAEMGYHPSDLAALLAAAEGHVRPSRTVVLLCENDLGEHPARALVSRRGVTVLATPPQQATVWAWGWSPFLFQRSAAYRVASAALARRTGDARRIATPHPARQPAEALRALSRWDPLVLLLPPLHAAWARPALADGLATKAGVAIESLPRPSDPEALRREPHDTVHLNAAGHVWLAGVVAARLVAADAAQPPADAAQPPAVGVQDK
jgi:lysophospholipase L1-like esterase